MRVNERGCESKKEQKLIWLIEAKIKEYDLKNVKKVFRGRGGGSRSC